MSAVLESLAERQVELFSVAKSKHGYRIPAYTRNYAMISKRGGVNYQDSEAVFQEVDEQRMAARFIVSTETPDRSGDVVISKGCIPTLDNYRRNPVVFFGHHEFHQYQLPIASSTSPDGEFSFTPEDRQITSWAYFHGKTPESTQVFHLVAIKALNTASLGFNPLEAERMPRRKGGDYYERGASGKKPYRGMPGWLFRVYDVIEWSIVGIPDNSEAIATGLSKGYINGDPVSPALRKCLQPYAAKMRGSVRSGYDPGCLILKPEKPKNILTLKGV